MPALTTQRIVMGGLADLVPWKVDGNVLSLVASKANNGQIPLASTTSWKDMSQYNNNCTLINQAGNSTSGFNSSIINGKTVYFNKLDGTDDYGSFINTPSLDITTNEFALCATFRMAVGAGVSFIISKALDSVVNSQYALIYSAGALYLRLNGSLVYSSSGGLISENTWYNFIIYRNSTGLMLPYLNKSQKASPANYANALITQPNTRLGAISSNVGGTAHSSYHKGDIASLSIYQAPKLSISQILKAETNIAKNYTGVA